MSAAYATCFASWSICDRLTPTVEPEEPVDAPHPVRVALREVVVHRDDVNALARQRVEVGGQRGDERLALAGAHLGDLAVVERDAAEELHVEVPHRQRALAGFAHDGERLGQDGVELLALCDPLLELGGLGLERRRPSSAAIAGSSALISRTDAAYCFSRRSLRLPKMRVRMFEIMSVAREAAGAKNKG